MSFLISMPIFALYSEKQKIKIIESRIVMLRVNNVSVIVDQCPVLC